MDVVLQRSQKPTYKAYLRPDGALCLGCSGVDGAVDAALEVVDVDEGVGFAGSQQ